MPQIDLAGIRCSVTRDGESVASLLGSDLFAPSNETQISANDSSKISGCHDGCGRHLATWMMEDGSCITIRPIRPTDEPMMVDFHRTLSDRTVYLRYFSASATRFRTTHDRLSRICGGTLDGETALAAERVDSSKGTTQIIGVGRVNRLQSGKGEIAILVTDAYQGKGFGSALLTHIIAVARAEGISRLFAYILRENLAMKSLVQKHRFKFSDSVFSPVTEAILDLE